MDYYLDVLRNYATFEGRASRKEYWMFNLFHTIFIIALAIIMTFNDLVGYVFLLYVIATIIPSIAVSIRRLHDINKSGWWFFISCVPLIGGIWYFVLLVTAGDEGANSFG
jgi:uncharacterized membrane protein YhaH (DUF805 family)